MSKIKYQNITVTTLSGGLADSDNPSNINDRQSPCLSNVEFTRNGAVRSRMLGDFLVGKEGVGEHVAALAQICTCTGCEDENLCFDIGGLLDKGDYKSVTLTVNGTDYTYTLPANFTMQDIADYFNTTVPANKKCGDFLVNEKGTGLYVDDVNCKFNYLFTMINSCDNKIKVRERRCNDSKQAGKVLVKAVVNEFSESTSSSNERQGTTSLYYLNTKTNVWIPFDVIAGTHDFDIVNFNCRAYYSNGTTDLRYAKFCPNGDCTFTVTADYPTCKSEYPKDYQIPTTIVVTDATTKQGYVQFGVGFTDAEFSELCEYLEANPVNPNTPGSYNQMEITIPNGDNGQTNTFILKNITKTDGYCGPGSTFYFETYEPKTPNSTLVGGTFFKDVSLSFDNGKIFEPNLCGNKGGCFEDLRIAENIKGHILRIHNGQLFIAGNPDAPRTVFWSQRASGFSQDYQIPTYVGDFFLSPSRSQAFETGLYNFDSNCGEITALAVNQFGVLTVHTKSNEQNTVYDVSTATLGNQTLYRFAPSISGSSSIWFRSLDIGNSIEFYLNRWQNSNQVMGYGYLNNNNFISANDFSVDIRETMRKGDFTNSAFNSINGKVYISFYLNESADDCIPELNLPDCASDKYLKVPAPNNAVLVYDLDNSSSTYRVFSIYKGWDVSVWLKTEDALYYGSSISGEVYQIDRTDSDKSGELEIESSFYMKRFNFDAPFVKKYIKKIYVSGYLGNGADIDINLMLDCNKKYSRKVEFSDIIKTEDCDGCEKEASCTACVGICGSRRFKSVYEFCDGEQEFVEIQPYITSRKGFWQLDTISMVVGQTNLPNDEDLICANYFNINGQLTL